MHEWSLSSLLAIALPLTLTLIYPQTAFLHPCFQCGRLRLVGEQTTLMKHKKFKQSSQDLAEKALKRLGDLVDSDDEKVALQAIKLLTDRAYGTPEKEERDKHDFHVANMKVANLLHG